LEYVIHERGLRFLSEAYLVKFVNLRLHHIYIYLPTITEKFFNRLLEIFTTH
jgi:hypothetical protein